ncbi:unnamed protein product [Choristocarpus tenellus]
MKKSTHVLVMLCFGWRVASGFFRYSPVRHNEPVNVGKNTVVMEGGRLPMAKQLQRVLSSAAVGFALMGPMVFDPLMAQASPKRVVGNIPTSGLIFKDTLNVEAFSDPKVDGVTLYLSDFTRPVSDKLMNGDFFSDPSSASMTCVRSGPMKVQDDTTTSKEGQELFKEDRSFFKSIVVRRLYDKEEGNLVYVAYSSKIDPNTDSNKSRFKSSLCALHIE